MKLQGPGFNKATYSGYLVRDPEVRETPGGTTVTNMTVAHNNGWKDKQTGEWKDKPCFMPVTVFGKAAERCANDLRKGAFVIVQGKHSFPEVYLRPQRNVSSSPMGSTSAAWPQ